jgi:hypothetical protein
MGLFVAVSLCGQGGAGRPAAIANGERFKWIPESIHLQSQSVADPRIVWIALVIVAHAFHLMAEINGMRAGALGLQLLHLVAAFSYPVGNLGLGAPIMRVDLGP